uniref:Uncharacterized protein n=1 Tax=Anguilla anguilla TaxID=7936 RepID=A0A0E9VEY6_ANGAN
MLLRETRVHVCSLTVCICICHVINE